MDLHFPGTQCRNRRKCDDAAKAALDHFVLDREHRQVSSGKVDIDGFAPHIQGQRTVILDVADGATVYEIVDGAELFASSTSRLMSSGLATLRGPANHSAAQAARIAAAVSSGSVTTRVV